MPFPWSSSRALISSNLSKTSGNPIFSLQTNTVLWFIALLLAFSLFSLFCLIPRKMTLWLDVSPQPFLSSLFSFLDGIFVLGLYLFFFPLPSELPCLPIPLYATAVVSVLVWYARFPPPQVFLWIRRRRDSVCSRRVPFLPLVLRWLSSYLVFGSWCFCGSLAPFFIRLSCLSLCGFTVSVGASSLFLVSLCLCFGLSFILDTRFPRDLTFPKWALRIDQPHGCCTFGALRPSPFALSFPFEIAIMLLLFFCVEGQLLMRGPFTPSFLQSGARSSFAFFFFELHGLKVERCSGLVPLFLGAEFLFLSFWIWNLSASVS